MGADSVILASAEWRQRAAKPNHNGAGTQHTLREQPKQEAMERSGRHSGLPKESKPQQLYSRRKNPVRAMARQQAQFGAYPYIRLEMLYTRSKYYQAEETGRTFYNRLPTR